jgi:MinD superfamily P-loop ATPase
MIISIASGKGGTGKTTVAANLALSITDAEILDCDVEEPNAHIFIKPKIKTSEPVFIPVPQVDDSKCNYCGKCREVCAYSAIAVVNKKILVFPDLCHGCGSCTYFCPQKAIKEVDKEIGVVESGSRGDLQFVQGRLNIAEPMAPPLIKAVKKQIYPVKNIKEGDGENKISNGVNPAKTVIIDAPPGTSCPVIAAIKDTDFVILVTEPTPFGLNDLILAVEVVRILGIPFGVIVNRSDLGNRDTDDYCKREGIPILMRIPFKKEIARAYSKGIPVVEVLTEYKNIFRKLFRDIKDGKFS